MVKLVQAVVAAEDGSVLTSSREHTGHQRCHPRVRDTHRGIRRLCRVGERAQEVEGSTDTEVTTCRRGVTHRGVELLSKTERDAGLLHDGGHVRGAQRQVDAERLEDVSQNRRKRMRPGCRA